MLEEPQWMNTDAKYKQVLLAGLPINANIAYTYLPSAEAPAMFQTTITFALISCC